MSFEDVFVQLEAWGSENTRKGRFDKTPVPKGCTSTYASEWIAAVLKRKK